MCVGCAVWWLVKNARGSKNLYVSWLCYVVDCEECKREQELLSTICKHGQALIAPFRSARIGAG